MLLKALRRLFSFAGPRAPKLLSRIETERESVAAMEYCCLALPPLPHDKSMGAGLGTRDVDEEASEGALGVSAFLVRGKSGIWGRRMSANLRKGPGGRCFIWIFVASTRI